MERSPCHGDGNHWLGRSQWERGQGSGQTSVWGWNWLQANQ